VAGSRAYHPTVRQIVSTDGLFILQFANLRTLTMMDGKSRKVVFNYDDPTT